MTNPEGKASGPHVTGKLDVHEANNVALCKVDSMNSVQSSRWISRIVLREKLLSLRVSANERSKDGLRALTVPKAAAVHKSHRELPRFVPQPRANLL